jgi:hypothetical protein
MWIFLLTLLRCFKVITAGVYEEPHHASNQNFIIASGRIKCFLAGPRSPNDQFHSLSNVGSNPLLLFASQNKQNPRIDVYTDYSIGRKSWHGIQRIGSLISWKRKPRMPFIPPSVQLGPEIEFTDNFTPASKSGLIYLDWNNDENAGRRPSLELRVRHLRARLSCFFPVFSRLHFRLISHCDWRKSNARSSFSMPSHTAKFDEHINAHWWIPEMTIDPFGSITTENKRIFMHNDRYVTGFRLRLRKSLSSLSDWNDGSTNIHLEYSIRDKQNQSSTSIVRLESPFDLSDWKNSVGSTKVTLIHESTLTKPN